MFALNKWRGYDGLAEFSQPVEARHLRINVVTFSGWPSLRFRVLTYNMLGNVSESLALSSILPSRETSSFSSVFGEPRFEGFTRASLSKKIHLLISLRKSTPPQDR